MEVVQYPDGEEGGEPVPVTDPTPVRQAPPPAPGPSSINVKQELKDNTKVTVKHGIANSFGFDDDDEVGTDSAEIKQTAFLTEKYLFRMIR